MILPPIVFNSGYSMKRKKFFENIGNITIFGLAVTLVCFVIYSFCSWFALSFFKLQMTNYYTNTTKDIQLDILPLMLFTALLCSSDVVAAVSIVDYDA
jgi:NhaP-type Na+/H+ or K+/H+ antiporter